MRFVGFDRNQFPIYCGWNTDFAPKLPPELALSCLTASLQILLFSQLIIINPHTLQTLQKNL